MSRLKGDKYALGVPAGQKHHLFGGDLTKGFSVANILADAFCLSSKQSKVWTSVTSGKFTDRHKCCAIPEPTTTMDNVFLFVYLQNTRWNVNIQIECSHLARYTQYEIQTEVQIKACDTEIANGNINRVSLDAEHKTVISYTSTFH